MMIQKQIANIVVVIFIICLGCNISNKEKLKHSDALISVIGAKNLQYSKLQGAEQLIYNVEIEYPATSIINEISQKLAKEGWKPLMEDYLNPGIPSSHVKGWSNFIDATKKPHQIVYQWLAQWENENHDILWCILRYSYPKDSHADLKNITVVMRVVPSEKKSRINRDGSIK